MFKFKFVVIIVITIWFLLEEIPDKHLHLITCDVGQGDAILLTQGSWQMLVDGGRGSQVLDCLGDGLPFWDKTLEVVVATHPDADHIGGLDDVFQAYKVEQFLSNGDSKDTAIFKQLSEALSREVEQGCEVLQPIVGLDLHPDSLSDVKVVFPQDKLMSEDQLNTAQNAKKIESSETILSAANSTNSAKNQSSRTNYNDLSIVLLVTYDSFSALLTGDLEHSGEQALLSTNMIKPITVLKVGHHGAKTASSLDFVTYLAPEISVISVGENNAYGHPSDQVLQNLAQIGTKILRTDQIGTIELITNGQWLKYENTQTSL